MGMKVLLFFYATMKTRQHHTQINSLTNDDGITINDRAGIEEEILYFFDNLMGKTERQMDGIDITVLRNGKQVSNSDNQFLTATVTEEEIKKALFSIGDLKSPGLDGYGAKFFKET